VTIALLGVPTNASGMDDGVAGAPRALRDAHLVARLRSVAAIDDLGDVLVAAPTPVRGPDGIIDAPNLAATLARIRAASATAHRKGQRVLVVGGDCPVLIGALAGYADACGALPGLLFVDGHEDAWPPGASTTGEAADMELGLLLGRSLDGVEPSLLAQLPRLEPAGIVVLGPRDRAEIVASGVEPLDAVVDLLDDRAVQADPAVVGRRAVDRLTRTASDWWLHVDLDVLSTDALPAVDYRQPGGLSWTELTDLTTAALLAGGCVGATVTIYNPDLDPDRRFAPAIVEFIVGLAAGLERGGQRE